jgi:ABC-type multidrug transport system fused ATPase/permease subunit
MIVPMFFYEAFGMAIPFCFGNIVNGVIQKDASKVMLLFVAIFILVVVRLVLHRLYMIEREHIKGHNEMALSDFITKKLLSKSIGQHIRHKEELSQSSMSRARSSIRYLTSLMLFEGITSSYSLILSFSFLWVIAPFAGIVLSAAFIIYIFGSLIMNKDVIEKYGPIDEDFKRQNDRVEEAWSKATRILSLGKSDDVVAMLNTEHDEVNTRARTFWIGFIDKITYKDFVNICALLLVWGHYVFAALHDTIGAYSVGFLLPLFSWSWSVVNNIWRVGHIEQEFNWCLMAVKKMKKALEMEPDIVDNNPKVTAFEKTPTIQFDHVTFSHMKNDTAKETIRDISFSIKPGEKVALIGSSGAGKTTIARLLQRAYDPHGGAILVDGHDLRDVSIKAWNTAVGEIPQHVDIFNGTLRENLLIGVSTEDRQHYADQELERTMDNFAIDFSPEEGLDLKIGPDGVWLSGGQQQRVAIAQIALRKETCVYIIDEATSSLDATTEKQIQKGFMRLLDNEKSALVVAHNLSTVRNICNKFIVLRSLTEIGENESQIEAEGYTFEDLYPKSPTLRRLMADQGLSLENKEAELV